jgi:hypothetical protein
MIVPLASIRNYKKVIKINLTTALNSEIDTAYYWNQTPREYFQIIHGTKYTEAETIQVCPHAVLQSANIRTLAPQLLRLN